MHTAHCICEHIPTLQLGTRIVVVQHHREAHKTTETAHLVAAACSSCHVLKRGVKHRPLATDLLTDPQRRAIVLFPTDDAVLLDEAFVSADPRPTTLVVPDGTWRQAKRAVRRESALAALPAVRLPAVRPSRYALRAGPRPECLATIEAIARALGVLEGADVQRQLEGLLDAMVAGTLAMRGQLRRL